MEINKIYFDLDGVLADFEGGVRKMCGMEPVAQGAHDPNEDIMWDRIREKGHFYDMLDLKPGAKDLFDRIYERFGDKCEILTGIPKPRRRIENAAEDKIRWVRRLLSEDIKINAVSRAEKVLFCTCKEDILIDDYDKNIKEWEEKGGTGLLFTNANDIIKKLNNMKEDLKMADFVNIDPEEDQFAYRYDTQMLIDKRDKDLDEDEITDYITEHFEGNSLLAVGDEDMIKVHFHTNEPWKVLEYCNSVGEIYDIVIEDMIRQSNGLHG